MRRLLAITVVLALGALGLLMPQWTLASTLTYIGLWLMMGGASVWLLWPKKALLTLRISAGVLGCFMTLAAVDFLVNTPQGGGFIFWLRSPITGFFVLGLPATIFALTGRSIHLQDEDTGSDSS